MRREWDATELMVVRNALEGIADGMALSLVRTSRSSVVRMALDFSIGVLNTRGELAAQGMCQPGHLGSMAPALRTCLNRYQARVFPGDIFIVNDPYEGGRHLPDIYLFKPIYVGDVLMAYLSAMCHHTDIGGRVPGGNACDSTEIYQEGLRIPPLKLYEKGEPNETMLRILEKAVRVPDKVLGDLTSQVTALRYGEMEYQRLVKTYGLERLLHLQQDLVDYTEQITRNTIRRWPDGSWSFTEYVDDDGFDPGPIKVVVNITKKGDDLLVDFTGTSPQCKGAIQPPFACTQAAVYGAIRSLLSLEGVDIPNTGGYMRPIKVTAPQGTFVNPLPPAPVAAQAIGMVRIAQAITGALAQMLPDKVCACFGGGEIGIGVGGYDKSTTPWKAWVQLEFFNEQGIGGWPKKDGFDAQVAGMIAQLANVPAETLEAEQPIRVLEYALAADTEGPGKYRGGLGMARHYQYLMDDTIVQMRADRLKTQPFGLHGGQSPPNTRIVLKTSQGERVMPGKFLVNVNKGDTLRVVWPGAGGWGDPLERDPQRVLADVIEERITPEHARTAYGVVLEPESRRIDGEATRTLRAEINAARVIQPVV